MLFTGPDELGFTHTGPHSWIDEDASRVPPAFGDVNGDGVPDVGFMQVYVGDYQTPDAQYIQILSKRPASVAYTDSLAAQVSSLTSQLTALSNLSERLAQAQAQVDLLTGQVTTLHEANVLLQDANVSLQTQNDALQKQNVSLQTQNDTLKVLGDKLQTDLLAAQATINLMDADMAALQAALRAEVSNLVVTIPGATPADRLLNLIRAVETLNHGQLLALSKALTGK